MSNTNWKNDSIQFPRLLAEIMATQALDLNSLAESMDLSIEEINELFDRADNAWESAKAGKDSATTTEVTGHASIKDVSPADLRLDFCTSDDQVSLELNHAKDYEEGTGGERMDIHRVIFIGINADSSNKDAAEDLAIALCETANASPELLAAFKAFALVSPA